jgi:integrase
MPLKFKPPRAGKTPYYSIRGTHPGCYVNRSSGSREKTFAEKLRKKLERDIESGILSGGSKASGFAAAAAAYMKAGGDGKYLAPLILHFKHAPLAAIDQLAIDNAAAELYPLATPATRNRQVYTPISAVLKRAGDERKIKRPKGWRGRRLTHWLSPDQARGIFKATARIKAPRETKIKFRVYLRMLCYTGMRMSEPLKLDKADVNLKTATATLRDMKNRRDRLVYLPPVVVADLKRLPGGLEGPGRLFSFHAGGRLRESPKNDARRGGRGPPAASGLQRLLPHLGDLDAPARRPRHLGPRAHRSVGRSRFGRPLCACGGERTGAAGGLATRREAGWLIRAKSVDSKNV